MSKLFNISYGPQRSDCTGPYYITLLRECTVREFINEWLKNKSEWGYFGIKPKTGSTIFGDPCCEYRYGEIITAPLPEDILDSKIKSVSGSGGWTNSDFLFVI